MKHIIAVAAAIVSLVDVCAGGNAVSAKAGMSTAEAIAAYEGTAEAARDPTEKEVEAPKDMKLVLLVGQSNMSGRAPVTDEFKKPITRCYKLNRDGKWVLATNPFHFDRKYCGVGPADEFARRYLAENCACVSSEGLKNQDQHHFDGPSVKALGARYYEAWSAVIGSDVLNAP